jgi:hypothetical protein
MADQDVIYESVTKLIKTNMFFLSDTFSDLATDLLSVPNIKQIMIC